MHDTCQLITCEIYEQSSQAKISSKTECPELMFDMS